MNFRILNASGIKNSIKTYINHKTIKKNLFLILKINIIESLPNEILDIIFNYVDLRDQLNLKLVSKLFKDLKIKDLYNNISYEYRNKLSDDILSLPMFSELEKLDARENNKITDKSIKRFKRTLKVLNTSCNPNITNEGIKGMDLHDLDASFNENITDEGIKGMDLHDLDASFNENITDEGIRGMNLHTLNANSTSGITNEGIKGMDLHDLDASFNENITDEGIKGMKLHTLYADYNENITDEGIKGMNLHTLDASSTSGITNEGIEGMNLYSLEASGNPNITDKGIKGMNLHNLYYSFGNPHITYEIKNGIKTYK